MPAMSVDDAPFITASVRWSTANTICYLFKQAITTNFIAISFLGSLLHARH